jgi:hypothetical protein
MSRVAFLPYPVVDDLQLRCTSTTPDVEVASRVEIHAFEASDDTVLGIDLELEVPDTVLERVLPSDEVTRPPVTVAVAVRSISGRDRSLLSLDQAGSGAVYRGALRLPKRGTFGEMQLEPVMVRTSAGSDPSYARHFGARLAWGETVRLLIDEPPPIPGTYLEIKWEDFGQSGDQRRRNTSNNLYSLDLDPDTPVLWLNEAVPDFRRAMESKARRGYPGRVRNAVFDGMAGQVWTTLLTKAISTLSVKMAACEADEREDQFELLKEWEQRVLHFWAPRLFPEYAKEEALAEVTQAAMREAMLPMLLENIVAAVQDWLKSSETFRGSYRIVTGEGV